MLKQTLNNSILTLTLNRPEVRNALNAELIGTLTQAVLKAHQSDDVRVVVLRGEGNHFSAGADLNWMLSMKSESMETNVNDAKALAELMTTLNFCRKPVIAVVQGAVMGGGVGLTACADIAIAQDNAMFALSETRLGLTPATISPFVVNAIGRRQARRYMLTGERFDAVTALQLGLVHEVAPWERIDTLIHDFCDALKQGGPDSHRKIKKLLHDVSERPLNDELMENLAWRIANQRIGAEGQEGIRAFLEKRAAAWVETEDDNQ
ncbi:enoyl-CoA hydratase-related protein [Reinekea blandensis]|uniref:Enoyl-CoA hydratase n=1 Tax=Reinekea blandensis MED297 TaxID=314283 RepID=A4B8T8_9GAMM|nr:enoyl-CoA hydratase-related protein [Reinekea blandensis]EAR11039.1 enoyl-CoA hydratase [Reinekea sp. MED297] [Reinekea blandensis MED297]